MKATLSEYINLSLFRWYFASLFLFCDYRWHFLISSLPNWEVIGIDVSNVFIPSLSQLLTASWNDFPSTMSNARFIACWSGVFAQLDKNCSAFRISNNPPRILPSPWHRCVCVPQQIGTSPPYCLVSSYGSAYDVVRINSQLWSQFHNTVFDRQRTV